MMQIGTIGRVGTVRATVRPQAPAPEPQAAVPARALVAIPGGRDEVRQDAPTRQARGGTRPLAGFLTQVIVASDPTLRPSRLERAGIAALRYAETARRRA